MSEFKPRFSQYLGLAFIVTLVGACGWLPGRDGSSMEAPPPAQGQTPVVESVAPPRNTGPVAQPTQPVFQDSGSSRSAGLAELQGESGHRQRRHRHLGLRVGELHPGKGHGGDDVLGLEGVGRLGVGTGHDLATEECRDLGVGQSRRRAARRPRRR